MERWKDEGEARVEEGVGDHGQHHHHDLQEHHEHHGDDPAALQGNTESGHNEEREYFGSVSDPGGGVREEVGLGGEDSQEMGGDVEDTSLGGIGLRAEAEIAVPEKRLPAEKQLDP